MWGFNESVLCSELVIYSRFFIVDSLSQTYTVVANASSCEKELLKKLLEGKA